jgi:hypothetical protein
MDPHEYVFVFQNLNILCIFSDRFFDPFVFQFFPGSGSVPVFWVDRFNDRSSSGNFDGDCMSLDSRVMLLWWICSTVCDYVSSCVQLWINTVVFYQLTLYQLSWRLSSWIIMTVLVMLPVEWSVCAQDHYRLYLPS